MVKRLLAPLGLFLCLGVEAATYYVTPAGAGATNGTSLANAFAGWADIPGNTFVAGDYYAKRAPAASRVAP